MLRAILCIIKSASTPGLFVPMIRSDKSGGPSVTLTFAYVTFIIAVVSVIYNHLVDGLLTATITSIIFWALAVVLYRLGKLDKAKFDLENKTLELDSEDEETEKEEE
jgi:hypothetical protein